MQPLRTDRLTIRPFEVADAPFVLRLLNEPSFIEHITDKGVRTVAAAADYLQQGPMAMYLAHGHGLWMVQQNGTGAPMGMCGLIKRDTLPEVDLGYAFVPEFWGQGYAREAAAACLAYGRDQLGLKGLLAIVSPGNLRSNNLLLALGFTLTGAMELAPGDDVSLFRVALDGDAGHPLDNPVWGALTTRHGLLAEGQGPVRRYTPQVAPFAALRDPTPASFEALAMTHRGETPFLHVVGENEPAIGLYGQLGFTFRRSVHFTMLRRSR
jgi:RimJ/RimL family protein N-acetyltransferase